MSSLFAFLHHVAAFTLVAALSVELVLLRDDVTIKRARSIRLADAAYGVAAGALLLVGLARVFCFEKGAAYYFSSVPFLIKLTLFVGIGLASIYPTVEFSSWSKPLKLGQVPILQDGKRKRLRTIIRWELVAIVLLIFFAVLMADGIGFVG